MNGFTSEMSIDTKIKEEAQGITTTVKGMVPVGHAPALYFEYLANNLRLLLDEPERLRAVPLRSPSNPGLRKTLTKMWYVLFVLLNELSGDSRRFKMMAVALYMATYVESKNRSTVL